MKNCQLPSQQRLLELLDYNPETGELIWRSRPNSPNFNGRCAGKPAFTAKSDKGYLRGLIEGRQYRAHRVIYKMMHGEAPAEIDHINGDRADNRICNLRAVSHRENMRNQTTHRAGRELPFGVSQNGRRFQAKVWCQGRSISLGYFDLPEQARDAVERYYG